MNKLLYNCYKFILILINIFRRPMTLGVRSIVINPRKEVLLVRHTYMDGWYLPGGAVKKEETALEAMKRELQEETGIKAHELQLFHVYGNFKSFQSDHVLLYIVKSYEQLTHNTKGYEIAEAGFFPLNDLPRDTSPATLKRLEEYFNRIPPALHWAFK